MFKQVKSIVFWSYLYKFRRRLTFVLILIFMIIMLQWIYSDIVEYLILTKQVAYLNIILPIKWLIVFLAMGVIAYLILGLFKPIKKEQIQTITKEDKKVRSDIKRKSLDKKHISKSDLFKHLKFKKFYKK